MRPGHFRWCGWLPSIVSPLLCRSKLAMPTNNKDAPILSSSALEKVHKVTQKCSRMLREFENHSTSWIDSEKAREITRTFAIEELEIRMEDYVRRYEFSAELLPSIITATVFSILAAFRTAHIMTKKRWRWILLASLQPSYTRTPISRFRQIKGLMPADRSRRPLNRSQTR